VAGHLHKSWLLPSCFENSINQNPQTRDHFLINPLRQVKEATNNSRRQRSSCCLKISLFTLLSMETIAVVPIFVNAGAAVLPTVMAALASAALLVFKPRALVHLFRRRPLMLGVPVVMIALGLGIAAWRVASGAPKFAAQRGTAGSTARYDWAKVAEALIAQQQLRQPLMAGGTAELNSRLPELSLIWSFRPEETMFLGCPAVAGRRVFAAGCQTDLGGYTGLLACLNSETGKPLWQVTQIKGEPLLPFFSSPAVTEDGKYLIIGQGLHEDRDCSLLCFEAATGQLHWAVKTSLHIESSPAIAGDVAVVGAGAVEGKDGKPVGDPGYCLAVRISDGKELWRQPVHDPESSPAIDENGIVYIGSGFNGNAVVAIRSESDEQLRANNQERVAWRTSVAHPMPGPLTLAGDMVIAGGGNGDLVHSNRNAQGVVIALNRKTGAILWQTPFDDAVLGGIACKDDRLICPVRTGEVAALARKDGRVLWRTRISGNAPVLGGCAIAGRRVYAVSNDGYLAVLDFRDGRVLKKICLNDQSKPGTGLTLSTPRIAGGRVIVGSETGGLRCLLVSGGTE
jgi:outer membrane protein assembly factor BamB